MTTKTAKQPARGNQIKSEQGLTWLQESFCRAYVNDPTNITEAAAKAGYNGTRNALTQAARRNLVLSHIQSRIKDLRAEIGGKEQIDVEWCLKEARAGLERCKGGDETNAKGYLDQVNRMIGAYEADNRQGQPNVAMVIM